MKTASRVGLIALGSIPTVLLWACDRRQADVPTGPTEVVVASVEVTPAGQVLTALGGTLQLAAVAKDAQGTTLSGKTFSWTSSATDVATVNASGVVTAVGNGTATIRATTDDVSGSVTVKVQQEPAQLSIRTQPSGAASGQPFVSQPAIEVQDANGNVVTIDNETVVTAALAQGPGTLGGTLTATAAQGVATFTDLEITGTVGDYSITFAAPSLDPATSGLFPVSPGAIAVITLTPVADTLLALGDVTQLTAVATDVSGNTVADAKFAWATGDATVATVDAAGVVTAIGNGEVIITATADNVTAGTTVTVAQAVTRVEVTPSIDTLASIGDTLRFAATAFDKNDSTVAEARFLWLSSNHNVAIVDTAGLATSTAEGAVAITAAAQGVPGHAVLTVRIPVASVAVQPDSVGLLIGDTVRLFALVIDADSNVRADRAVTWASSNTLVATVTQSDSGALLAGVGRGSATITATSEGVSGTAETGVIEVTAEFPIATTANAELGFGAAFDGTNYLVVMDVEVEGGGNLDVGGQLVSQAGDLVGSFISTGRSASDIPLVAFDGTNYLMVWQEAPVPGQADLFGQLISPAGTLVGFPFAITATQDVDSPYNIGFGGGAYLVTYVREPGRGFYGKLVSPLGTVGSEIAISTDSVAGDAFGVNSVLFDGSNFFVLWLGNQGLRGRFVDSLGSLLTEITVSQPPRTGFDVFGAGFDGTNFLVAWSDAADTLDANVFGQLVTSSGTLSGDVITISENARQQGVPVIASNGTDFFVAWWEGDSFDTLSNVSIRARALSGTGMRVGPEFTMLEPGVDGRIPLVGAVLFGGGQYFAVVSRATSSGTSGFDTLTDWDVFGAFVRR